MNDSQGRMPTQDARSPAQQREDRLKAALKANMARRKAQARARGAEEAPGDTEDKD